MIVPCTKHIVDVSRLCCLIHVGHLMSLYGLQCMCCFHYCVDSMEDDERLTAFLRQRNVSEEIIKNFNDDNLSR